MRWMGLDVGERRIGVALSDPGGLIAQPHATLRVHRQDVPIEELERLLAEHDVEAIVVGLPKRLDGSKGPAALAAERFAEELRSALGIEVVLWDERLSSVEADRRLIEAGVGRRRRRTATDRVAAAIILQSYLDRSRLAEIEANAEEAP